MVRQRAREREEPAMAGAEWKNNQQGKLVLVMKYGSSVKMLSKYGKPRRMVLQKWTKENRDAKPKQGSVEKSVPRLKKPDDEIESDDEDDHWMSSGLSRRPHL
jgi:hypothetical protein